MRDSIFIGHATPEDNEFTLWLQSKLINEGYKCECDISFLIGGEADYWKNLQDFLEKNTAKYILVVSKDTFTKNGVLDEWEYCKSIERQYNLSDFIIPVKIDKSPFNARIGLNRRNVIPFDEFWSSGLKRLLRKLSHDQVQRSESTANSMNDWYENVYSNWQGIQKGNDTFYSNWTKILGYPKVTYFYRFHNEDQAQAVLENNIDYPAFRHGVYVVTFNHNLNFYLREEGLEILPLENLSKANSCALNWYQSEEFPVYQDFKRLFVRLLNTSIEFFFLNRGLLKHELSNSNCYYFPHKENEKIKGKFILNEKMKNIGITGKYYDSFWHYGMSVRAMLYPELCYSFKSHIVFSDDGTRIWDDNKRLHRARRDKGSTMRNKEWRDQLLAFLACLKQEITEQVEIPVSLTEVIALSSTPVKFQASFSYIEPNDLERLKAIDDVVEEEEYFENEIGNDYE